MIVVYLQISYKLKCMKTIDTRGKQCPIPLILAKKAIIDTPAGEEVHIIADSLTAYDNLTDYLNELNIGFHTKTEKKDYIISFVIPDIEDISSADSKKQVRNIDVDGENSTQEIKIKQVICNYIVVIKEDKMGCGNDDLGKTLLREFLKTIAGAEELPSSVILYNSGIRTAFEGTETAETLIKLNNLGVAVYISNISIDFMDAKKQIAVGLIADMQQITELMKKASHIVYP